MASHVTLLWPIGKADSDGGSHDTIGISPELSVAYGVSYVTFAVALSGSVGIAKSPSGHP